MAIIGDLESLSNKTVKKLALDVDIANQPVGEEISVHQHRDHFPWKKKILERSYKKQDAYSNPYPVGP